jgi:hypothetical protein
LFGLCEIVITILIDKGIDKLAGASKAETIVNSAEGTVKYMDDVADVADVVGDAAKHVDDVADVAGDVVKQAENAAGALEDAGNAAEAIEGGTNTATTIDYSYKFDRELANFNDGYEIKTTVDKDLILVQYSSDAPDASLCYWTMGKFIDEDAFVNERLIGK